MALVATGYTDDSGSRARIEVYIDKADDAANNRTLIYWYCYIIDNSATLGGFVTSGGGSSWSANIEGSTGSNGNYTYDMTGDSGWNDLVFSGSKYVYHDNATGTKSISINFSFVGASTVGNASISTSYALSNYDRSPTVPTLSITSQGTWGNRSADGLSVPALVWSGGVNNSGPQVTFQLQRSSTSSTTGFSNVAGQSVNNAYSGTFTDTGLSATTDYWYKIYASNSDGTDTSSVRAAYAPPIIQSVNFPSGIVGKAYTGTVTRLNVTSFAITSGTLPPGVTLNTGTGTLSGTPNTPGTFTFTLTATRTVSTAFTGTTSASYSIFVAAGGPWVYRSSPVINASVSSVSISSKVATLTTSAPHGITEINQPITISGLSGPGAVLNGKWFVLTTPAAGSSTFTVAIDASNLSATSVSGTVVSNWKRSSLNIKKAGSVSQSFMRVKKDGVWTFIK